VKSPENFSEHDELGEPMGAIFESSQPSDFATGGVIWPVCFIIILILRCVSEIPGSASVLEFSEKLALGDQFF
jgi:hypothetical protein